MKLKRMNGLCAVASLVLSVSLVTAQAGHESAYWATNIGGPAYLASDGTQYEAEPASVTGGSLGRLETVKGSQDPVLYQSFRVGNIEIAQPIEDGTYDLTFHFAEHEQLGAGERLFDVIVEGEPVVRYLDVMRTRDGKVESALTVTIPGIRVSDGELNVTFAASVGQPVLSAFVVRAPQPAGHSWELVWSDEFDYEGAPDPDKWNIDVWPARVVNDEDQAYTARAKNLRVEDGHLVIEAHKEDHGNAAYTSGRVHTHGKSDFLYGRFEARAMLPRGVGTWPAIWMLPSDPFRYATTCEAGDTWQGSETCDAWPNSGEIDILEHVGYEMGHVHGTVHNRAYYWINWEQRKGRILLDAVDERWHVYALEWSPDRIDVFVDDTLYFTYVNENDGWESWPYDHPFHLILNIAVGGVWGRAGGGIDDEIFPQRMLVDYVRVYERATNRD
ncbi:MAG: family 16 glycosylhydrolase [Gammaproteobacteria bacterium]